MNQIKKEDGKKYVRSLCENIIGQIRKCGALPYAQRNMLIKDVEEIMAFSDNAFESSDPFMQNVDAMRAQGLWLPENINKKNVRAGYFNTARGKAIKLYDKIKHTQKIIQSPQGGAVCGAIIEINNFLERVTDYDII